MSGSHCPRSLRDSASTWSPRAADLDDREQLREIEEAALTLVFRYMFLLHTEARGYLPVGSSAYRPQSAVQLAEDTLHGTCHLSTASQRSGGTVWAP